MSDPMVGPDESELDRETDRRRVWWFDGGALAWSVGTIVIGLAISTGTTVSQNAQGDVVLNGGTSLLVPYGAFALGVCVIVTQITARQKSSVRLMPLAWVFAGGLVAVSVIAVSLIGPSLMPVGAALVAACFYARRWRATSTP